MDTPEDRSEWHPKDSLPKRVVPGGSLFQQEVPAIPVLGQNELREAFRANSERINSGLIDLQIEVKEAQLDQALLGLATTRDLLHELRARLDVPLVEIPEWAALLSKSAAAGAHFLLTNFPPAVLDYRTVGSE